MWWSPAALAPQSWDARSCPHQRNKPNEETPSPPSTCWRPTETGRRTATRQTRRRARPAAAEALGCTPPPSAASPLCSSSCWPLRWARAGAASGSPCLPAWRGFFRAHCVWPQPWAAAEGWYSRVRWRSVSSCTWAALGCSSAVSSALYTPCPALIEVRGSPKKPGKTYLESFESWRWQLPPCRGK